MWILHKGLLILVRLKLYNSIMKIVSWNVRGIGKMEKRRAIREVILDSYCNAILIQESKIIRPSIALLQSLGGLRMDEWEILDADGSTGDILVEWNSRCFQHKNSIKGVYSVSAKLWYLPIRQHLWITLVYGPCEREHKGFLQRAGQLGKSYTGPMAIGRRFQHYQGCGK